MILLFEKATISATSVAADSSGANLDFWMIPAANLITISAIQGQIILYFRDGNPFSETLSTGEALTGSFRFATVTFNVTTGKESEVAENFYKFILAGPKLIVPVPSVKQIFKFSNVSNEFADIAEISSIDTIKRHTTYDTISGGGGGSTDVDILDSTSAVVAVADAALGETVKMMDASMSHTLVGTEHQISVPSVAIKPAQIFVQPPSATSSSYPGDFIDQYLSGVFDYWKYTSPVNLMRLGADVYTLDAATPNPWGGTSRYTSTDGSLPSVGAYFTSYGAGEPYIVCDWLHRVMWYVGNLGGASNRATILSAVAANNAASFKGFNDWILACVELLLARAYPSPSTIYYNSPNMLQRGIVSGYNEATIWLSRTCEISPTNGMAFYAAYDWRRVSLTSTVNLSGYMCRTIKDTDPFLP